MKLQAARLFQNGMILQREKPVVIWGKAKPGEEVTISMQGLSCRGTVDQDGHWRIACGPFHVSEGDCLSIVSCTETLTFSDVLVGDVYLAGGQSNMEFHMRYDADLQVEKPDCANPCIRLFDYPRVSYPEQIEEADYTRHYGFWRKCTQADLERFPAVAYYFAKEINARYRVPVGIIGCNWGATRAAAWMSEEEIAAAGGQAWLDDYARETAALDLESYEKRFRENPASWKTDLLANPITDLMMFGCTMEDVAKAVGELGADLSQMSITDMMPSMGPKHENRPGGLYQSMLCQVAPYTIRGILWYQGEADADAHPEVYQTLFPGLIASWRKLWNDETLPFLFVQLAPLEDMFGNPATNFPAIRAAQQHASDTMPFTGMAVTTDVGMQYDIHPKQKKPVGYRLALLAERIIYGENVLCEAPSMRSATVEKGKARIRFAHAGTGLYLKGSQISGLRILEDGTEWNMGNIRAEVSGTELILYSEQFAAGKPLRFEIAMTPWHNVNLYNSEGIPARPCAINSSNI